jgi:hypothetical protein
VRIFRYLCLPLALLLLSVPAYADLVTFSSLAAFTAAAPGLPVETFESGVAFPNTIIPCAGPLSSAAGGSCFPVATLLPGAVYSASPGPIMALVGAGNPSIGNTSKIVGPATFADTLNVTFAATTTAVGFDVFPGTGAGSIQVSVFDPSNVSLGVFTFPGAVGPNFFGVVSASDLIGRINIMSTVGMAPGAELIDNVAFGNAAATVPESSSLLLLAAGVGLVFRLRKRN